MSSYSLLGTSCIPHTLSCTSNHKFLPLHDPVYKKYYTYTMQHTDNTNNSSNSYNISNPDMIYKKYPQKLNQSCKSCKS